MNTQIPKYDQEDCPFAPGELVSETGIYEMCHTDEDRVTVLLLRASVFPWCKSCGHAVRYKLVKGAPHISEDPDFADETADSHGTRTNGTFAAWLITPQIGLANDSGLSEDPLQTRRACTDSRNL